MDSPSSINAEDPRVTVHGERARTLLISGEAGIGPIISLVERLRSAKAAWKPLVLMESTNPFPFRTRPSTIVVPGIPAGAIACMPLLESWNVPSRLATKSDFPGCFDGTVIELADIWLKSLGLREIAEVEIFHCDMTDAIEELARQYGVPCQQLRTDKPVLIERAVS